MEVNFEIKGLDKLNQELKLLPEDFRTKALNSAVRAAAVDPMLEAKLLVPKKSGNLASAIYVAKVKSASKWIGKYSVKIKKKGNKGYAYYAHMVENGTSKMPAQPFMRVAFERRKQAAVIIFGNTLRKKIDFYNRKIQRLRA